MRKFVYESPEMEIITFLTQDVITTSGGSDDSSSAVESEQPALPWD